MRSALKAAFRLYRRCRVYYCQENATGQQESLHTSDRTVAACLVNAKNDAASLPGFNRELGRTYMCAADPEMANRTWKDVMDFILAEKTGPSRQRWYNASRDKALVPLWKLCIVETRADQLLRLTQNGNVSTNVHLRRLHNFALDMIWLAAAIIPKRKWPKVKYREKRSITMAEHQMIVGRERCPNNQIVRLV